MRNMYTQWLYNTSERGFTLLFAALLASLVTALGLAMFSIAKKELILSSLGRDSQFAFYTADTGAECAMYWDFRYDAFATSTVYTGATTCGGADLADFPVGDPKYDGVPGMGGAAISTFWFESGGRCAYVTVTKQDARALTTVEALGYNTACSDTTNPRRLERAVRAVF